MINNETAVSVYSTLTFTNLHVIVSYTSQMQHEGFVRSFGLSSLLMGCIFYFSLLFISTLHHVASCVSSLANNVIVIVKLPSYGFTLFISLILPRK